MSLNEQLAEALRQRQLNLLRHQVSVQNELDRFLTALAGSMAGLVASISPTEPVRHVYRQGRLEKLLEAVSDRVSASYREIRGYHVDEMAQLADAEALYLVKKVNDLIGEGRVSVDLPAAEAVGLVKGSLISGAPLADWWQGQADSLQDAFTQQMRIGVLGGETDADLIKRVRGTAALGFKDGLLDLSKRRAKILVRGTSSAITSTVRQKAVEDNPRVFRGIQQISVLDGRTSHVCVSYAGKVWTVPGYEPVGHGLPYNGGTPRHPNCRSTMIAVLRENVGGAPAEDIGFDAFLEGKSAAFVDQLLGRGRADLYRAGKITLSELVDQRGRPLTIEQLKELH